MWATVKTVWTYDKRSPTQIVTVILDILIIIVIIIVVIAIMIKLIIVTIRWHCSEM